VRILNRLGFFRNPVDRDELTLVLDISPSLAEIRRSLHRTWRNHLAKAERSPIEIRTGTHSDFFRELIPLYLNMARRKNFEPAIHGRRWQSLQKELPESEKPVFFMAYYEAQPIAGLLATGLGETGFPLFSASNDVARLFCASYLLNWRMIE